MLTQSERSRSYVDPATNKMVISDFDLTHYLNWIKGRPIVGSSLLANFLHEWTHRWCFHSPVGSALALLRLRAATRSIQGRSAFDDHVRCMTAMTILEPIAEGLSLFAEFDTYPGKSPWLSQTLVAASMYFAPNIEDSERPLLPIQGVLQSLRRNPDLLERKAGIYAHSGLSPYLIGYLSVKALWCQMAASCAELNDQDLFLSYVRSYIYDDPGMVSAVLRPAHSEVHAARNIVNHLISRISKLVSFKKLSESVSLWISSAEEGKVDVTSIGSNATAEHACAVLFDEALVEDVSDESSEKWATWTYATLEERSICIIGSTKVSIGQASTPGRVNLILPQNSTKIYTLDEPEILAYKEGDLFVIGTSNGHGMIFLLGVEQKVYFVSSFGKYSEVELEIAKRLVANNKLSISILKKLRVCLKENKVSDLVWRFIKERVDPALRAIYGPLCTLNVKNNIGWKQAFDELQKAGLYGMLDQDGELTRALAGIGLLNTITTDADLIRGFSTLLDIEEDSINLALNLEPKVGLPFIAKKENSVMALV